MSSGCASTTFNIRFRTASKYISFMYASKFVVLGKLKLIARIHELADRGLIWAAKHALALLSLRIL